MFRWNKSAVNTDRDTTTGSTSTSACTSTRTTAVKNSKDESTSTSTSTGASASASASASENAISTRKLTQCYCKCNFCSINNCKGDCVCYCYNNQSYQKIVIQKQHDSATVRVRTNTNFSSNTSDTNQIKITNANTNSNSNLNANPTTLVINTNEIHMISCALYNCSRINEIDLSFNQELTGERFQSLIESLCISVQGAGGTSTGTAITRPSISTSNQTMSLRTLSMRHSNIGRNEVQILANAIRDSNASIDTSNKCISISRLVLSGNRTIGIDGATILLDALVDNATVKSLYLDRTFECINTTASFTRTSTTATTFGSRRSFSTNTNTNTNTNTKTGPSRSLRSAKQFTKTLETLLITNTTLQLLDLSDNQLCSAAIIAMSTALQSNTCTALTKLILYCNNIRDSGIKELAVALQQSTHTKLHTLDIGRNNLTYDSIQLFFHHPTTTSSTNNNNNIIPSLRVLNLRENNIGNVGAKAIVQSLQHSSASLQKLDISLNGINDVTIYIDLFQSLRYNSTLTHISIQINPIGQLLDYSRFGTNYESDSDLLDDVVQVTDIDTVRHEHDTIDTGDNNNIDENDDDNDNDHHFWIDPTVQERYSNVYDNVLDSLQYNDTLQSVCLAFPTIQRIVRLNRMKRRIAPLKGLHRINTYLWLLQHHGQQHEEDDIENDNVFLKTLQ